MGSKPYFMPYQEEWLADRSRVKVWEKSRRIGATYVASFEDVHDCLHKRVPACWFSSADESAAREYIQYCEQWIKAYRIAAESLGEIVIDSDRNIKTYAIEFPDNRRIHALSSNPKAFRSKGGKVTLDEFAWHDDARAMWAAARPCITWGFPLRILSTHNGIHSLYNQFITKIRKGKLNWSLHKTDIFRAVECGLVDKIFKRRTTPDERREWVEQERESVADESTWLQEYCCEPQDEATAFLSYDMLRRCERDGILRPLEDLALTTNELYVGMDIARRRHLSVIWVLERVASFLVTRMVVTLVNTPFREQIARLYDILRLPGVRRACIDASGLGMQLAEEAQTDYGMFRVEPVTFSAPVKADLAYRLYTTVEDTGILIPEDYKIRDDWHSVRKLTTAAGNVRFDVAATEAMDSHADRFWAGALAVHAADQPGAGKLEVSTRARQQRHDQYDSYVPAHGYRALINQY